MGKFVALHTHTEYSTLDGYSTVEQVAKRAKALGQTAVAITDHGDCGGHLKFQSACRAEGIKPIFGMEGYLIEGNADRFRSKGKGNPGDPYENSHIVLLAENQVGLKNLWKLSSLGYLEGFYRKPNVNWETFAKYSEGIIATSACMLSFLARAILDDDEDRQYQLIGRYLETFGENNFFLELHTWQFMDAKSDEEIELNRKMTKINQGLVRLGAELEIPLIVVNDSHYTVPEHHHQHEVVWAISTGSKGAGSDDQVGDNGERGQTTGHMMDDEEVIFWMEKHGVSKEVTLQAISNTAKIAERCNVTIESGRYYPYLTGTKEGDREVFQQKISEGFQQKIVDGGLDVEVYAVRRDYEMETILSKDFDSYFVVVADYCTFAKNNKIMVGPGRGSGGGSLIAWLMHITEIDPVARNLPFERFMNPGRSSYPDFDLDFPQSKRQQIIQYLKDRYGEDKVCIIGNYTRRGPKQALNDCARVMGIPFKEVQEMTKVVDKIIANYVAPTLVGEEPDENEENSWEDILADMGEELRPWANRYPDLFSDVRDFMGTIRGHSVHASGIIISSEPLMDIIPLRKKTDGPVTSQFENKTSTPSNMEIEDFGINKFDVLGLRQLDTLMEVLRLATGIEDPRYYYDMDQKKFSETEQWKKIAAGDTLGIFTLETPGMTKVAKDFNALNEIDIADLISVNRPGLARSGGMTDYLDRRAGRKAVSTKHSLLDDITGNTFGMFVYQEQIMFAVQVLANYTLSEADNIRRIMGKKHQEELDAQKDGFIERCMANEAFTAGLKDPAKVAKAIWADMEHFGSYSFNLAHAMAYGYISCWGVYMRHQFPLEYYVAALRTDISASRKKIVAPEYIRALRKLGYQILPPDVNASEEEFSIDGNTVRYGLKSIKGIGDSVVTELMMKRPFTSLEDMEEKVAKFKCNKAHKASLIKIGALDTISNDRAELLTEYYLRNDIDAVVPDFDDEKQLLNVERELVGDFITRDPMLKYIPVWENMSMTIDEIDGLEVNSEVWVGGSITRIKEHVPPSGKKMAFLDFENMNDKFNVTIFSPDYLRMRDLLEIEAPIMCKCYKGKRGLVIQQLRRMDWI